MADDALTSELALTSTWGRLAAALPAYVRAVAAAYAAGHPGPPAPTALGAVTTVELARRAARFPELAATARALWRLAAPAMIEDDPAVAKARQATVSWAALAALAAARDDVARRRLGASYHAVIAAAHGVLAPAPPAPALPLPVAGWAAPLAAPSATALAEAWRSLATIHGVPGAPRIVASASARPRAFVAEPGREVVLVVPVALTSAAARFAALHELGHALVALLPALSGPGAAAAVPRVVDEAAAAYVARLLEVTDGPLAAWAIGGLATAARVRRRALAAHLATIELALPRLPAAPLTALPPWALWHDAGAQATYVAAEDLGDALWRALGPTPAPGALGAALAAAATRVDGLAPT